MPPRHFSVQEHVIPCQHIRHYPKSLAISQEDVLHLAVKQYTPHNYQHRPGDVTIIACHASAFPKELYEPIWDDLVEYADNQSDSGFRIRNVWIADVANQGDSGVLNQEKLGNEPSYHDSARDLLLMVNHFRAEMPRPILGIGHSMGGTVIVNLALLHPRLFTTIIPIEPIIKRDQHNQDFTTSYSLTYKQDTWPSLTAAHNSVRRHPFYRTWDSRTLDLFRTHSLRNAGPPKSSLTSPNISPARADPTTVTLKTTRDQETLSYARAAYPPKPTSPLHSWQPSRLTHPDLGSERYPGNAFYRPESFMTFVQLPFLRPSCHYIYGAKTHLATNQAAERALKLQTTGTATGGSGGAEAGRVTETVVDGVGHFLAFEVPELIAGTAGRWMTQEVRRWREEEGNEQAIWGGVERSMRGKVEGDWHLWQERMYGERVRGMAAEAKKRKATKLQKENYKGGKGVPKL